MKNMKIAAAAMVMVMLASAAIVGIGASAYDADDDTTTTTASTAPYEYKVNLSNNDTVTVELMSNINYYSALGGASISWEVKSGEDTITASEGKYTKNNVSIEPSVTGEIGENVEKLTMDVKKETGATGGTTSFLLTATIKVTKGTTDETGTNTATVTLESISYKIDVIIDDANDVTFDGVEFVKNVSKTVTLSIGSSEIDTDDENSAYYNAKFYATGLPAGLSMTPDGKISGIPTESTNSTQVTIFIEKTNGTAIKGSLDIKVVDFSFTVISAKTTGAYTSLTGNNGTYIVEQGDTLTVKTTTEGANYISVCDQNGASKLVSINNNNTCDLSAYTTGTGAYKVYIGYADDQSASLNKVLASFDLYVVGHVAGVGSDIIIGSR